MLKIKYSEPLTEEIDLQDGATKTTKTSRSVLLEDATVEQLAEEVEELEKLGYEITISIGLKRPKE
jgi:hypothetical protein